MKPTEPEIPNRRYFRIGEVSALTGIESYVLRYWETEFPGIRPARSSSGQRLYRKQDIEIVLKIRDLLHTKRYTIEGAKQHLTKRQKDTSSSSQSITLEELRKELVAIRDLLSD